MKKTFLLLFLISLSYLGNAQYIELDVKEAYTNIPISYVNFIYQGKNEGTISNLDGKVKLAINKDTIVVSHLGYETKKIVSSHFKNGESLSLIPSKTNLQEVVLYGDSRLKEKIKYIFKNYYSIYVQGPKTYEATYKETYKVNDTLARLSQARIRFWNKTYSYDFQKPLKKQIQVGVDAVDYAKSLKGNLAFGGHIENYFSSIHLNGYLLYILNEKNNLIIEAINKNNEVTEVNFSASSTFKPTNNNDEITQDVIGTLVFDNETGGILKLTYKFKTKGTINKISKGKKTSFDEINPVSIQSLYFTKEDGKLRLARHNIQLKGKIKHQTKDSISTSFDSHFNSDLFITKISKGKKIPLGKRIDLSKGLFNYIKDKRLQSINIKDTPTQNPKILLTQEELAFINRKEK